MNKCHKDLVSALFKEKIIKIKEVAQAMQKVDRKYYCFRHPYQDSAQSIGYGATISAPHMHAYALEYLYSKLITAKNVLDVGSGTGYLTAAMAYLVPPESKVFGIEHVPQLVKMSIENISKSNINLLKAEKLQIRQGDGRQGWPNKDIKFDVIHVGAAAAKIPQALLQQLAQGGKMVIPVGGQHQVQTFQQINKINGAFEYKKMLSVRYIPLTDLNHQLQ